MIYICKNCQKGYTLPQGDYLIEKKMTCKCGEKANDFEIYKVESVPSFSLQNKHLVV